MKTKKIYQLASNITLVCVESFFQTSQRKIQKTIKKSKKKPQKMDWNKKCPTTTTSNPKIIKKNKSKQTPHSIRVETHMKTKKTQYCIILKQNTILIPLYALLNMIFMNHKKKI